MKESEAAINHSAAPESRPPRPIRDDAESILLAVGDPDKQWATSTSLILPFSYRLTPSDIKSPSWTAREIIEPTVGEALKVPGQPDDLTSVIHARDRRKYFTSDSAYVLFGRSKRFLLSSSDTEWPRTSVVTLLRKGAEKVVTLHYSTPELWLFEAGTGSASSGSSAEDGIDPLWCGQLRIEIFIGESNSCSFTLADLLQVNEELRLLRDLFHGDTSRILRFPGKKRITPWLNLLRTPVKITDAGGQDRWLNLMPEADLIALENSWDAHGARTEGWSIPGTRGTSPCDHSFVLMHDDDRAFVWSTAVVKHHEQEKSVARPEHSTAWSALLNVNDEADKQLSEFMQDWVKDHTYYRWAHYGTLYGFTSYSGVLMTSPFNVPVWQHMRTMYLDQTRLLLYLRSVVFVFSNKLVQLSAQMRRDGTQSRKHRREIQRRSERLLEQVAQFVNLYQFPLLSNQQQALELYTLQRRHLDIDQLFDEVRREAEDTHRFLEALNARDQQEFADVVQIFGIPLGVLGVLIGLASLEIAKPFVGYLMALGVALKLGSLASLVPFGLMAVLALLSTVVFFLWKRRRR